jgi:hypothetical protein
MTEQDKAVALAEKHGVFADTAFLWKAELATMLADYKQQVTEAIQKDCRTCVNLGWCNTCGPMPPNSDLATTRICTKHNQWTPMEFKQLTRSE